MVAKAACLFFSVILLCGCSSGKHNTPLGKETLARFNAADAIKTIHGRQENPKRKLLVISRPGCIYCSRLDTELSVLPDVTIYQYLVAGSGDASLAEAAQRWCSARPVRSDTSDCDSSVIERNTHLVKSLGISAVPTIIFPDGYVHAGWLSAGAIDERLKGPSVKGNR